MPCGKSGAFYHLLNNDFPNNKKTLSQMTILHEIFNQIYLVKQRKNFFFCISKREFIGCVSSCNKSQTNNIWHWIVFTAVCQASN